LAQRRAPARDVRAPALGVAAPAFELGLALPTRLSGNRESLAQLLSMAEIAEANAGWDYLWVTDSVIALGFYESIVLLSACAARTSRVRLGIGCMSSLGLRHPLLAAQQLANLDALSDGRLTLVACPGWGSGDHVKRELDAFGLSYSEKACRMEESIGFLRRVSSERLPSFEDGPVRIRELDLQPAFVQRPLPIWMAANPPLNAPPETVQRLLGRVARLGDGWMTYAVTPEVLSERVRLLRELRAARGDQPGADFPVSVFLSANVAREESHALADAARAWRHQSTRDIGPAQLQAVSAVGTPDRCSAFIRELVQAGATNVVLDILAEDRSRQLQTLTAELLPGLAQA
jgi:alkanesulfonate monooxygenase SsuD/methylene tetrahydromethanopterin reductase-like flavin-dependent oxidoreductase (luciferase family)